MVAAVIWASITATPPQVPDILAWDKTQHFLAYAGLSFWFGNVFVRVLFWPLFLASMGVGLEYLQGMGGVRELDSADMLANSLGVLAGWGTTATVLGRCLVWMERGISSLFGR